MLNLPLHNYIFITPFLLVFFNIWVFFIKNNFYVIKNNLSTNDILKNSKFNKKIHFLFLLNYVLPNFFYFFIFLFFIRLDFSNLLFNHIKISNFLINLVLFLSFLGIFLIFFLKNINITNLNYNLDYYFSILNIIITTLLIFFSSNIFSTIFILELNSLLIFYKFSVSKFYFKKNNLLKTNKQNLNFFTPKHFLNLLFFQYWVNFFSSLLLMYFTFNIISIYGSSEWFFINFVNNNFNNKNMIFLFIIFLLGFFLKIGLTPNHLFKIEIYKGLPFLSIFFYTFFYFISFFMLFLTMFFYNLFFFSNYFYLFVFLFVFFGSLYILLLLFDSNFFKSFLAYSTIINSIFFFFLILAYI